MDLKRIAEEIMKVNDAGAEFLAENEDEIFDFIKADEMTPEENLQKELLLELLDHIYGIRHTMEYMKKDVVIEGDLGWNERGEIVLAGKVIPHMTEVEVYVYDKALEQEVWTKTFVGGASRRYLVGLSRDLNIDGLHARIRA